MSKAEDYQMAIDLLCFHLGLSEDEAKEQIELILDEPVAPNSEEH